MDYISKKFNNLRIWFFSPTHATHPLFSNFWLIRIPCTLGTKLVFKCAKPQLRVIRFSCSHALILRHTWQKWTIEFYGYLVRKLIFSLVYNIKILGYIYKIFLFALYEDLKNLNQIHNANCRRLSQDNKVQILVPENICIHPTEAGSRVLAPVYFKQSTRLL